MHPRRNRGFAESVRFRRAPADFVFCAARIDEYLIDVGRGTAGLVGKEELETVVFADLYSSICTNSHESAVRLAPLGRRDCGNVQALSACGKVYLGIARNKAVFLRLPKTGQMRRARPFPVVHHAIHRYRAIRDKWYDSRIGKGKVATGCHKKACKQG